MSYDMAKQFEIQKMMEDKYDMNQHGDHSYSDELSRAASESYKEIFDRSKVDMRMTGGGLVIDSSISFK